jgi:Flp pilus assembly protein TadG
MRAVFVRFRHDRSGNVATLLGLTLPILLGFAGFGTEVGLWYQKHRKMQGATDSAAISAAIRYSDKPTITAEAQAVAASFGFVAGANGVTIEVNRPPVSGSYTTSAGAVEVILQEPQQRLFSALFIEGSFPIRTRSVALGDAGPGCVLALNPTANAAATTVGNSAVNLINCSLYDNSAHGTALTLTGASSVNALSVGVVGGISGASRITATNGIMTGIRPVADPYADSSFPAFTGCDYTAFRAPKTGTINPGVYCNGMTFDGGANVTLNPGIYYVDRGSFYVAGNATLSGTGVTIVFTSSTGSNWPTATIAGGANINLTGPTSGDLKGIVMFGDRKMTSGTQFRFAGGASQYMGGSIYLPKGAIEFAGGTSTKSGCTKLIGDTIAFVGPANLSIDCDSFGGNNIGAQALLVE